MAYMKGGAWAPEVSVCQTVGAAEAWGLAVTTNIVRRNYGISNPQPLKFMLLFGLWLLCFGKIHKSYLLY